MPPSPPPARLILAIETSNLSAWTPQTPVRPGIALAERKNGAFDILRIEPVDPTAREDGLHSAIDRAFSAIGASPASLARVAVSAGPGGFTSLRVAVTTAKLLAESLGCEVAPVCSAAVAAASAAGPGPFAVALASKGEDAWVRPFDDRGAPTAEGRVMTAHDLRSLNISRLVGDRFLPPTFIAAAQEMRIPIDPPVFDPACCLRLGAAAAPVDPLTLSPIYPRPPEAVRKWLELHGAGGGAARPENQRGA